MKKLHHICIILLLFTACSKNENSNIPLVNVNIVIHTNDPAYNNVSVPGGWTYLNGGSRGILIYRVSSSAFRAFDRHCTYDSANSCALIAVEVNNITALDDCCGSKFLITDGSVTNGPASFPLKEYNTSFDGSVLRIFN